MTLELYILFTGQFPEARGRIGFLQTTREGLHLDMNSPTQAPQSLENKDSPRGTSPITVPVADTLPGVETAPLESPLAPRIMASPGGSHSKRYRSSAGDEPEIVAFSPPAHRSRLEAKGSAPTARRQRDYQRSGSSGVVDSSGQVAAVRPRRGPASRFPLSEVNSGGGGYVDNSNQDFKDGAEDVGEVDVGLTLPNNRSSSRGSVPGSSSSTSSSTSSSNSSSSMNAPPSSAVLAQYIRRFRTADPAPAHERRALAPRDAFWWNSGSIVGPCSGSSSQGGSFDGSSGGSATQNGAPPGALPGLGSGSNSSCKAKPTSSLASLRARMQRGIGASSESAPGAQQPPQRERDNYFDGASDDDEEEEDEEEDDKYLDNVNEEAEFFVSDSHDSEHGSVESSSARSFQASSVASSLNSLAGALPGGGGFLEGFADGGDRGLDLSDAASVTRGHAVAQAGGRSSGMTEDRTADVSRLPEDPVRGSMELDVRASMLLKHCDALLGAHEAGPGAAKPVLHASSPPPQMHALSFGAGSSSAGLLGSAGTFSPLNWGAGLPAAWAGSNASFNAVTNSAYPEFAALAGPVTGHVENVRHGVSQISLEEHSETLRLTASSMHEDEVPPSDEAMQSLNLGSSSSSSNHNAYGSNSSFPGSEHDASLMQQGLSGHETTKTTTFEDSSTPVEDLAAEIPSPPDSPVAESPPLVQSLALPLFSAVPHQGQLDAGGELPWAKAAAAANSSASAPASNSFAREPPFSDDLAIGDDVESHVCYEAIAGLAQLSIGRFIRGGISVGALPMFAAHLSPDADLVPLGLKANAECSDGGHYVRSALSANDAVESVDAGSAEALEVMSLSPLRGPTAASKRERSTNDASNVAATPSDCLDGAHETPTKNMSSGVQDSSSSKSWDEVRISDGGGIDNASEVASEGSVSLALASFSVTSPAASPEEERLSKGMLGMSTTEASRDRHGDAHDAAAAAAATAIALAKAGIEMGNSEVHSPPATTRPRDGEDEEDSAIHSHHADGSRFSADDDSLKPSPPKNRRHGIGSEKSDDLGLDSSGSNLAGSPDKDTLVGDGSLTGGVNNLSLSQGINSKRSGPADSSSSSSSSGPSSSNGGASDNSSGLSFDGGRFGTAMSLGDDAGGPTRNADAREDLDPELAALRIRELALEKELKRRKGRKM